MDPNHIQKEDLAALVPEILEDECEDPKGVIDNDLVTDLINLFRIILREQSDQQLSPYGIDDVRLVTHIGVTATQLHHGQTRRFSGRPYICHPRGAQRSMVEDLGRTRPTLIAAEGSHDSMEDALPDRQLQLDEFRRILLENFKSPEHARKLEDEIRRVSHLVNAVTKVDRRKSGHDRIWSIAASLRKLYRLILSVGPDAAMVKFADRRHNALDYHKSPDGERVHQIAVETYEVYARLANAFGLSRMAGILTFEAARVLNPELLGAFDVLRTARYRERVYHARVEISAILDSKSHAEAKRRFLEENIDRIETVEATLADFVLRNDNPLGSIGIDDLRISTAAPLSRINVIVKPEARIEAVIDHIVRGFVRQGEGDSYTVRTSPPGELPKAGVLLDFRTTRYETVRVRIIDSVSFARVRRGIIPVSSDNPEAIAEFPQHMRQALRRIMAGSTHDERRVFPLSREQLLRPMITVYDRGGKEVHLPKGSTPLDLAAKVHWDTAIGALEARQILPDDEYRPIGLFDELQPGMRVEIISCLRKGDKSMPYDPSKVDDSPARLLFYATEDGRSGAGIRLLHAQKYHGVEYNSEARGRAYTEKVALLFGVTPGRIIEIIRVADKRWSKAKEEAVFTAIGRGTIELISLLSGTYFVNQREWRIRVRLGDRAGALERFLQEFANKGINIDHIVEHAKGSAAEEGELKYDLLRLNIRDEHANRSPFDIMKSILKLSMDYDITIDEGPGPLRAAAGRVGRTLIRLSRPPTTRRAPAPVGSPASKK